MSKICLLYPVEKRLLECLQLFIEAKNDYFLPDKFSMRLNSCIQTLRNVTFVLQNLKNNFPEFDKWYSTKQDEMRNDSIMKWLINARNTVVKQGDLETLSILRVSIVESWLSSPVFDMQIHPFTNTNEILDKLIQNITNKNKFTVGLLRVERRWIDSRLPDHELLESLTHVFTYLNNLVLNAHLELLNDVNRCNCSWFNTLSRTERKIPPCMLAQKWDRTIWINFQTGDSYTFAEYILNTPDLDENKILKHYPNILELLSKSKSPINLEEEAKTFFELAKQVLSTDGRHLPMVFYGFPNGSKEMKILNMKNRAEKHLIFNHIAVEVERKGIISIILVNEIWMAPAKDYPNKYIHAVEAQNRVEGLQVIAADNSCNVISYCVTFKKDKIGKIHLGKESKEKLKSVNILEPILKVWRKQ